jgi:hypothetical protein
MERTRERKKINWLSFMHFVIVEESKQEDFESFQKSLFVLVSPAAFNVTDRYNLNIVFQQL